MKNRFRISKDELTVGHIVFYYSFIPILACFVVAIQMSIVLFYLNIISFAIFILIPFLIISSIIFYLLLIDMYVMPSEIHRRTKTIEKND